MEVGECFISSHKFVAKIKEIRNDTSMPSRPLLYYVETCSIIDPIAWHRFHYYQEDFFRGLYPCDPQVFEKIAKLIEMTKTSINAIMDQEIKRLINNE